MSECKPLDERLDKTTAGLVKRGRLWRWGKRALTVAVTAAIAYVGTDRYLDRKYDVTREQKATVKEGIEAVFRNPSQARTYLTEEYAREISDELQEAGNYTVEVTPLYGRHFDANTVVITYFEKLTDHSGEVRERYATAEMVKQLDGTWKQNR